MKYEELIRGILEGNANSKEELYENVKGLIYKEIRSFYSKHYEFLKKCGYLDYEDLIQYGNLIFSKAVYKYKLDKDTCFTTYLVQSIRNWLNMYFFPNKGISNDYKTNTDNLLLDDNLVTIDNKDTMFNNLCLKIAMEKLTHEEQELIYDKFYRGLSSKEMSDKYGVTYVSVRKKREKAINKLREYMKEDNI